MLISVVLGSGMECIRHLFCLYLACANEVAPLVFYKRRGHPTVLSGQTPATSVSKICQQAAVGVTEFLHGSPVVRMAGRGQRRAGFASI